MWWGNPQKLSVTSLLPLVTMSSIIWAILFIVIPFSFFMVLTDCLLCLTISSCSSPARVTTKRSISIMSLWWLLLKHQNQHNLSFTSVSYRGVLKVLNIQSEVLFFFLLLLVGYRKAVKVKKIVPDETRSFKKREGALFDTFFFFEKFPDDNMKVSKQSSPKIF